MSSAFGGGGSGEIRYVISVDDAQALSKLQGVSQQFSQMGQNATSTAQQVEQVPAALDQVATEGDKVSQSSQKMTQSMQQSGQAAQQAGQQQQTFGQVLKNNVANILQIGTGILGLVMSYTQLQRTQNFINKLQTTEANQRRMLTVLTQQHAIAVAKYGANSQEALNIEAKINILQERHQNTVEQLDIRQQQLNESTIGFGLSMVQTATGVVQAATGLKTYKSAADAASVATTGLATGINKLKVATVIGAILVGIEVAAQAVSNNFLGFRDRLNELYNWLVKLAPAFQPVIDAIWTIGKALTALFTGDIDSLTKMFSNSAAAAPAAVAGVDDLTSSLTDSGKEAIKAQKEIDDLWTEIGKAPNLTSALKIKVDKDKITKKILDYLPDKLSKDIKIEIKGQESIATIKDSFAEIFDKATADPKFSDKSADKLASGYMKFLKEKFPNAPGSKEMQAELAATISGPDTEAKLKALIEKWKLDPKINVDTSNVTITPITQDKVDAWWDNAFKQPEVHRDFLNGKDVTKTPVQKFVDNTINALKGAFNAKSMEGVGEAIATAMFVTTPKIAGIIGKWFTDVFTLKNFTTALAGVLDTLKTVGTAIFMGIVGFAGGFAKIAGPIITQWFKDTFTQKNFTAALDAIKAVLNTVGVAMFLLLGEGWTLIKDVAGEIGKWFTSTFTVKNLSTALNTVKTVFQNLAATLFGWIVEGFGLIKDIGGQIIGAITSAWSGTKNKTVILSGAQIDLSGGSITKLPPSYIPPGTPQNRSYTPPNGYGFQSVYFNSQNEQALLGSVPKTREELYALLNAYGIHGSTGPNTGLPQAGAKFIPVSDGKDDAKLNPLLTMAKISSIAMTGLKNNIMVGVKAVQLLQTAIGSLSKYGANLLNALAKAASTSMNGLSNNLNVGLIATQLLDIAIRSLAKYGINLLNALAKASSKDMSGYSKNFDVGIKATQTLQTAIDSLVKFGIKNFDALAKASSKDMNGIKNNVNVATKAVQALQSAINSLKSKSITIHVGVSGPGLQFAQHGMHETLIKDTLIYAHKGEKVDIGPSSPNSSPTIQSGNNGNSSPTVNQVINLHIDGNDIINQRNLSKRIRLEIGQKRDRLL